MAATVILFVIILVVTFLQNKLLKENKPSFNDYRICFLRHFSRYYVISICLYDFSWFNELL